MDIVQNISRLLYEHDCVIIPGFGGFVANYKPAQIDYDRNFFAPPSKDIGFNARLTHNDGLLVSEVSRTTGLGYPVARKNVDDFVQDLNRKLHKGKKILLDNLGTFFLDKEKNLQFEPERNTNYLVDSYGLSPFEFELLEEFDIRKKIQSKVEVNKAFKRPVRKKVLRATLIAVPLLVVLVLVPIKTGWVHVKTDSFSLNPFKKEEIHLSQEKVKPALQSNTVKLSDEQAEESKNSASQTTITASQPSEPEEKINEQPVSSVEKEPVSQILSKQNSGGFFVIAGSFKSEKNAAHLMNLLQKEGYSSKLMNSKNGFFRVALQEYGSFTDAQSALIAFRESHPGENYWILKH